MQSNMTRTALYGSLAGFGLCAAAVVGDIASGVAASALPKNSDGAAIANTCRAVFDDIKLPALIGSSVAGIVGIASSNRDQRRVLPTTSR